MHLMISSPRYRYRFGSRNSSGRFRNTFSARRHINIYPGTSGGLGEQGMEDWADPTTGNWRNAAPLYVCLGPRRLSACLSIRLPIPSATISGESKAVATQQPWRRQNGSRRWEIGDRRESRVIASTALGFWHEPTFCREMFGGTLED